MNTLAFTGPRAVRVAAVCAAALLAFVVQVHGAAAANSLSACFTLGGRPIPVSLAGLEATNRYGQWVPLDAVTLTKTNGCVGYNLWGTYTRYNLRVVVAGVTPDHSGLVLGVSRYYAPGAYAGSYFLGRWETTVLRGNSTSGWLDAMSNGTSANPALAFAAFSDRLGPSFNGSVLCTHYGPLRDSDCDGRRDTIDVDPWDPSR